MASIGLVPAPEKGAQKRFLTSFGSWEEENTVDRFLCADGTWRKADSSHRFLRGDATWQKMDLSIKVPTTNKEFEDLPWGRIKMLSDDCAKNGSAKYEHMLGWTKSDVVNGDLNIDFQIVAFNNTDKASGGKAGFTFYSVQTFANTSMTTTNAKSTWSNSYGRSFLNGAIFDAFPFGLSRFIETAKIPSYADSVDKPELYEARLMTTDDKLWLPSEVEIFGYEDHTPEGTQFDYYATFDDGSTPPKRNTSGQNVNCWLRTQFFEGRYEMFHAISSSGSDVAYASTSAYSMATAFIL